MPVISFKNKKTVSADANKSLSELLQLASDEDTLQITCDDYPIHKNVNPETDYGYWHVVFTKQASELEDAWKKLVAKVKDKKFWRLQVVTTKDTIGFRVYVPYYLSELDKKTALQHLKECLPITYSESAPIDTIAFGLNPDKAKERAQKIFELSNTLDQSDLNPTKFLSNQAQNPSTQETITYNFNMMANQLDKTNNYQYAFLKKQQQINARLSAKLADEQNLTEIERQQIVTISNVALNLTRQMEQYDLQLKQEHAVRTALFNLRDALNTKLENAVTGVSSADSGKLNDYLVMANLPQELNNSLNKLNTGIDDQRSLFNRLEALKAQLLTEAATAVKKGNVARMKHINSLKNAVDNVVTKLLDKSATPTDQVEAIYQFEKLAKVDAPIWKSILKVAGAFIISAIVCVAAITVSAAIGFGIGVAVGAWTGPGAMLTALAGLFHGTITGAALGVAIGVPVATALTGVATLGLTTHGMFKYNAMQKASRGFANAAKPMVPEADEERRSLLRVN